MCCYEVWSYCRDQWVRLLLGAGACGMTVLFLSAFHVPPALTALVLAAGLICGGAAFLWDYLRRAQFYRSLMESVDGLDRKYLAAAVVEAPHFLEGRLLHRAVYEMGKSMTETVSAHRRSITEFKEYIELWVHQVKLPIAALTLMERGEEGTARREQLRRLDRYTDQVLYYVRAEQAEKDYLIGPVSLKRAVGRTALKFREDLRGFSLETEGLDAAVMTDGKWLEFMLGQMLSNSVKYRSEERPPVIRITAAPDEGGVGLTVWDNGVGIPACDLPYVFDKSFTGENGRKGASSTGMGLYLVKNLCQRLGHRVTAESRPGEYTAVTITFADNDYYRPETLQNCKVP